MKFEEELCSLLNRYSKENGSNTPDFILAEFLNKCLGIFGLATLERDRWYGTPREVIDSTSSPQVEEKPKECEHKWTWGEMEVDSGKILKEICLKCEKTRKIKQEITLPEKVEMNTAWDLDKRMCKAINQIIDYLKEKE